MTDLCNSNPRNAGRKKSCFTINLDNIEESIELMLASCSTPSQKLKLIEFQNKLCKVVLDDQTKKEEENSAAAVLDQVLLLNDADMVYILDNIWENITHKRYAKLFSLFDSLSVDEHCEFFTLVGSEVFNKSI